jgi:hypothetical protein
MLQFMTVQLHTLVETGSALPALCSDLARFFLEIQ